MQTEVEKLRTLSLHRNVKYKMNAEQLLKSLKRLFKVKHTVYRYRNSYKRDYRCPIFMPMTANYESQYVE